MVYSYVKEINDKIVSIWQVDRIKGILKKLLFIEKSKVEYSNTEELVIDKLIIPDSIFDERIDTEPIKIKTLGTRFLEKEKDSAFPRIKKLIISKGITSLQKGAFAFSLSAVENLEIPEGVTIIPDNCFSSSLDLISVKLPSTINIIGTKAFSLTTNLKSINIPAKCRSIGFAAFQKSALSSVTFEKGTQPMNICDYAFSYCPNLTEVNWPEKCVNVPVGCFCGCSNLKNINFKGNIASIKKNSFAFTGITSLDFSNSLIPPQFNNEEINDLEIKITYPYYL